MVEQDGITWGQLAAISSAVVTTILAGLGWFWRQLNGTNKEVSWLREQFEAHRVKVASEYATTSVVVQVEERLTASINRMSDQITDSMERLTERFEVMLERIIDLAGDRRRSG